MFGIEDWLKSALSSLIKTQYGSIQQNFINNDLISSLKTGVQDYSPTAFNTVMNVSEKIILPIAGVILTYVVVFELYNLVVERNNMYEQSSWTIYRWIFKTSIAVYLTSKAFQILAAIIEVGVQLVNKALPSLNTQLSTGATELGNGLEKMSLSELLLLTMLMALVWVLTMGVTIIVQVLLTVRVIELYLMLAFAPIPFSMFGNAELKMTASNYMKNVMALGLQGIVLVISFIIYLALQQNAVYNVSISTLEESEKTFINLGFYPLILGLTVWQSRNIAKTIVGAN